MRPNYTLHLTHAEFVHLTRLVLGDSAFARQDPEIHERVQNAIFRTIEDKPPTCTLADAMAPTGGCQDTHRPVEADPTPPNPTQADRFGSY